MCWTQIARSTTATEILRQVKVRLAVEQPICTVFVRVPIRVIITSLLSDLNKPICTVPLRVPIGVILTSLSDLTAFFIEVEFIGTWTDARQAVFLSAADR